jgi:hypothetical protein
MNETFKRTYPFVAKLTDLSEVLKIWFVHGVVVPLRLFGGMHCPHYEGDSV